MVYTIIWSRREDKKYRVWSRIAFTHSTVAAHYRAWASVTPLLYYSNIEMIELGMGWPECTAGIILLKKEVSDQPLSLRSTFDHYFMTPAPNTINTICSQICLPRLCGSVLFISDEFSRLSNTFRYPLGNFLGNITLYNTKFSAPKNIFEN